MKQIICIGNILMKDDSIAIVLGNLLKHKNIRNPIAICETDSFYTDYILSKSPGILLIDSINLPDITPGDYIVTPISEINYTYNLSHDYVCNLASKTGSFFGIQVESIEYSIGLSPSLKSNLKLYLNQLLKIL